MRSAPRHRLRGCRGLRTGRHSYAPPDQSETQRSRRSSLRAIILDPGPSGCCRGGDGNLSSDARRPALPAVAGNHRTEDCPAPPDSYSTVREYLTTGRRFPDKIAFGPAAPCSRTSSVANGWLTKGGKECLI